MNVTKDLLNTKRSNTPPLKVLLKRASSIESVHRVHAVVCDTKGRVLMKAGSSDYETFIRSALKPFQAIPFISSCTAEKIQCGDKGIAISCSSHSGTRMHSREAFKILWNSELEATDLKCPVPKGCTSPLEHNCSGKHAAFLATCKKMGWPLVSYLEDKHPLQTEVKRRVADLLRLPPDEILTARDDCGAPTMKLELTQIAFLFAHLSGSRHAELEQICRAMIAFPELIGGKGLFDTELINRAHDQLVSKGGSEGVQCICKAGEGIGIAIKAEDGSKRAKHAVAIHLLRQLEWLTPSALEELEEKMLSFSPGVHIEVQGELRFQES